MFNNIILKRMNDTTGKEIERIRVPLTYGPKEKYVTRLQSDPDLTRPVQAILPRMSFEIDGISYDPGRKQNSLLRNATANTAYRAASQYMGVPYDLSFTLEIYAKNTDDGTQIVEQILPYFTPDYTVTINSVPEMGFLKDIPIILNSVNQSVQYEGNYDSVRYINWTLNFTVKGYYYGPVQTPKIIRKVITNIWNDPELVRGYITKINTGSGSGTFKIDDVVYQGDNYLTATAFGRVNEWNATNGRLVIGATQGRFDTNNTIRAVSSNASYNIASFDATPIKLASIEIVPDPLDAEPGDDFGYTTTITEWPDTEDV